MEKSSFFNSVNGDRKYNAEDFANHFNSLLTNGIFPNPSTNLQVLSNNNMTVTIKAGKAWINGYCYTNDSDLVLPISVADGVLNRIDRIAIRLDTAGRAINAIVKKGTFASSPVAPTLQRDSDGYELGIADIAINAGATAIAQANITDLRQNQNYCGIVDSLITPDTATLFIQFEDGFNTWFAKIKNILSGDVAANLQNEIDTLTANKTNKNDYVANNAFAVTTGTSTAYTVTLDPAPEAYSDGMQITIVPHIDCGIAPTLNINGLGALTILQQDGSSIPTAGIKANSPLSLVRVGSNFFIRSGNGGATKLNPYFQNTPLVQTTSVPVFVVKDGYLYYANSPVYGNSFTKYSLASKSVVWNTSYDAGVTYNYAQGIKIVNGNFYYFCAKGIYRINTDTGALIEKFASTSALPAEVQFAPYDNPSGSQAYECNVDTIKYKINGQALEERNYSGSLIASVTLPSSQVASSGNTPVYAYFLKSVYYLNDKVSLVCRKETRIWNGSATIFWGATYVVRQYDSSLNFIQEAQLPIDKCVNSTKFGKNVLMLNNLIITQGSYEAAVQSYIAVLNDELSMTVPNITNAAGANFGGFATADDCYIGVFDNVMYFTQYQASTDSNGYHYYYIKNLSLI